MKALLAAAFLSAAGASEPSWPIPFRVAAVAGSWKGSQTCEDGARYSLLAAVKPQGREWVFEYAASLAGRKPERGRLRVSEKAPGSLVVTFPLPQNPFNVREAAAGVSLTPAEERLRYDGRVDFGPLAVLFGGDGELRLSADYSSAGYETRMMSFGKVRRCHGSLNRASAAPGGPPAEPRGAPPRESGRGAGAEARPAAPWKPGAAWTVEYRFRTPSPAATADPGEREEVQRWRYEAARAEGGGWLLVLRGEKPKGKERIELTLTPSLEIASANRYNYWDERLALVDDAEGPAFAVDDLPVPLLDWPAFRPSGERWSLELRRPGYRDRFRWRKGSPFWDEAERDYGARKVRARRL